MPLENGLGWTYLAHAGLQSFPDNIRVVRQVPVDAAEGWELEGELGVAHLAWSGGNLITDMMANARFVPPLIVLSSTKEPVRWRGWVDSNGRREPAKATIQREQRKMDLLGQTLETTRSTVDLKISTREVQIQTWFAPGIGIVQQEQRTNRKLNLTLQYLGKL